MRYAMSGVFKAGSTELVFECQRTYRVTHIRTGIHEPTHAIISGILVNNDKESQLLYEIDAYDWSVEHLHRLQGEFLKQHGLLGKTDREVDEYLDEHELSMPEVGRVTLPTVEENSVLLIEGRSDTDFGIILLGYVQS
jgi:hypothetical protein